MQYNELDVAKALLDCKEGISNYKSAKKHKIPKTTLLYRIKSRFQSWKKVGRKTALLRCEEMVLAQNLARLGDFGCAMDVSDLQWFVKYFLNDNFRFIDSFANNTPGIEWVRGFLSRHKEILSKRMCENISKRRANISELTIQQYFGKLKITLENVPTQNTVNYDETNLQDDPKTKLQIFRRGSKHRTCNKFFKNNCFHNVCCIW